MYQINWAYGTLRNKTKRNGTLRNGTLPPADGVLAFLKTATNSLLKIFHGNLAITPPLPNMGRKLSVSVPTVTFLVTNFTVF